MGCNCGGATAKKFKYVYTTAQGRQQTYDTEIEAKAAQIRAGGTGSIRTEAK
jgi:hypothetical protein